MHRKLCLGCSLAGSGRCLLLLAEILLSFSSISLVAKRYWLSLPLVSGIMLLCSASLYMLMLTLGGHRPDCSVLGLTIFMFMMKFGFSCQSLKTYKPSCATSLLEQTSWRMQLSFTQPTADIFYSSFSFIFFGRSIHTYFFRCKVSASHISASTRCLILRIFSKTFPSAAHPKNFSCPRVK